MLIRLSRLQVQLLPLQTARTGLGDEPDFSFPVPYLPMLRGIGVFDVAGPDVFKPTEFIGLNAGYCANGGSAAMLTALKVVSFPNFDAPTLRCSASTMLPRCSDPGVMTLKPVRRLQAQPRGWGSLPHDRYPGNPRSTRSPGFRQLSSRKAFSQFRFVH